MELLRTRKKPRMQTFLPHSDFKRSAEVLDYRRLGKQRVEAYQVLRTLLGISNGWKNHPCTKMWKGYEAALKQYGLDICAEWVKRGYKDTLTEKIKQLETPPYEHPPWITEELCISHRSNLLRKDPIFYGKYNWDVSPDLPYVWPV